MHSKIIQFSFKPILKENYIKEEDFYEILDRIGPVGADYVDSLYDYSDSEKDDLIFSILEYFSDICDVDRKKRTVKIKASPDWTKYKKKFDEFKKMVNETTFEDFVKDRNCITYKIRNYTKTLSDSDLCFYVDESCENENDFLGHLLENNTLYIGGIIDYHF